VFLFGQSSTGFLRENVRDAALYEKRGKRRPPRSIRHQTGLNRFAYACFIEPP
jgi:hypothetical protein